MRARPRNAPSGTPADARSQGFSVPLVRPSLPPLDDYREALAAVWESRMLSNFAEQAQRFEALARDYTRQAHVRSVSSCDIGLALAIASLEVPRGSEAVLPSFTFNSTVNAVLFNGLVPRFADVDAATYCLDPAAARRECGENTGLVVATHVFGVAADTAALAELAGDHGAALLFDAAQAFATFVGDEHVSARGSASVFSFSATKVVTSGEGGLAVFADADAAERFTYLRSYGFQNDYISRFVGLNGKFSELHAALGCLTLPEVETEVAARGRLVERYRERLGGVPGIGFQSVPDGVRPSNTYFAIDAGERRDELMEALAAAGVQTKAYFRPLHSMSLFDSQPRGPLPVTERLSASLLCLPLYSGLEEVHVERVCETIAKRL